MKRTIQLVMAFLMFIGVASAQRKAFLAVNDIFGTRAFIENRGQFSTKLMPGEKIHYALDNGNEKIFFTDRGLVYEIARNFALTEEERERMERGEVIKFKQARLLHVRMNWLNASPDIVVEGAEKTGHYFSYGPARHLSYGYKKITYKNVYNKIDVEYIIPEDKAHGIKYSLVLHPGADINDVKIAYTGDVEKIRLARSGEVIVSTALEDITEHAPRSFYEDQQPVVSSFRLNNNVIGFNLPDNYNRSKTLVVDPWVSTITGIATNNYGYDVDYDDAGNVFIYGGTPPAKISKYTSTGTLVWTFQGVVTLPAWTGAPTGNYIGNFVVMKSNGKVYTGQGFNSSGATIIRLDVNGVYDNLMTPAFPSWKEVWDMAYHCSTGNVYGMGGSTASNQSAGIVNQASGTLTPVAFCTVANTSAGYDVVSHAIDDAGEFFWIYAGPSGINNMMARINSAFTSSVWLAPSTFPVLQESANKNAYVGGPGGSTSNGFNCMGVNQNYLFYYDGLNLAAYNKANGNIIASTTIPGNTLKAQGGIAVDDCNVLYLGGNGSILSYSFSGTAFTALTPISLSISNPNQYVYDIKLDKLNKLLYVCGSGFVGTWTATNSQACSPLSILCYNPLGVDYVICGGSAVTLTPVNALNLSNPTFSVNPGNLSNNTGTFVLYPNANTVYTTYVIGTTQSNAVVTLTSSATVSVFPQPVSAPTTTQSSCTSTFNAFNLNLSFNPPSTPVYTISWSPAVPFGINSPTQTSSSGGIAPAVYTATIVAQAGCSVIRSFTIDPAPAQAIFNITPGGPYGLSCLQPALNLTYTPTSFNYTTNNNIYAPLNGPFPVFTSTNYLGTYTVTAEHPQSGCVSTKTFAITQSTTTPSAVITPSFQNITCSLSSITNVTAVASPTVNIEHQWISPQGSTLTANSATAIFLPGGPGTYTHCIVNLANGCRSCKEFTVASNDGFPVFSVQSPQSFTLGCTTKSVATINIVGADTYPMPGGALSYTILGPPTGQILPPGILSGITTYTVNTPGTWTIVTRDNASFCATKAFVSVLQNTVTPSLDTLFIPRTILTCEFPKVELEAISNTPNVSYLWSFPGNPGNLSGSTITVNSNSLAPTTSLVANYTLTVTDNSSTCKTTTVIPILQNLYPPKTQISGGNQLTCITESLVLTNSSSTGIPPGFFNPQLPVVGYLWIGPTPQQPLQVSSTYVAYIPGVYTLEAVDRNNGCKAVATKTVSDFREYPVINKPLSPPPFVLDCGSPSVKISPILTSTGVVTYTWITVAGATVSGQNSGTLTTNASGRYEIIIRNEESGCENNGFVDVIDGSLKADFAPDKLSGFAPLEVTFTNNSSSSTGNSGVSSVWSFGNGQTQVTASASLQPRVVYNQPGTYSVSMHAIKGSCVDTVVKFIDVEIPSSLNIPNIFTPNGDGVNDVFFLKTENITDMHISIYDRWGHLVYELETTKGNIAWDGKNQRGKDVPDGVYFYVLNAQGADGASYENKGNITLAR